MKLVKNWKAIAARSHSMWSIYLGIIVLLVFLLAMNLIAVLLRRRFERRW